MSIARQIIKIVNPTVKTRFRPSASRKLTAFNRPVRVFTRTGVMTLAA
jgi:hypothetical protein